MWESIKSFFLGSETIFWARLQVLLGALAGFIVLVDPNLIAPLLPVGWAPWVVFANGLATEFLRRRGDPELGK